MKRVLLLPDTPGWAYDIIAQNIVKHIDKSKYKVTIKYVGDILSKRDSADFNDYDVVYAFFWYDMFAMEGKYYKNFDPKKVVVGVHGINSWEKRNISVKKVRQILSRYAGVGCISKELCDIFKGNRVVFTPSGFDPEVFTLRAVPKFEGTLKVLWVGDPSTKHHGDIKGYNDFIEPVISSMGNVELITATKESKIAYKDMPDFYEKGHVLVCMSKTEGSPLPVIEAMACGRPVISTAVGIVPEVVRNNKNGLIIPRSKGYFKRALQTIMRKGLNNMGKKAREAVEDRTWENSAKEYQRLFDLV